MSTHYNVQHVKERKKEGKKNNIHTNKGCVAFMV